MPDPTALLQKIIHQIRETAPSPIGSVRIALGELIELDPASLQTRWRELSLGTPAEHAQLHLRLIPAEVQCMVCFQKYQPAAKQIHCPYCGSFGAKILTGEECYLESIETQPR